MRLTWVIGRLLALLQVIDVATRSPVETSSNAGDEKVSPDAAP